MSVSFHQLSQSEDIYVKKYYNTVGNMPDCMIFHQCDGQPSDELLDYVKAFQEILEKEHKRRPRVLFNCEVKPGYNKINHFFSIIGKKIPTDDQWWTYSGEDIDSIWIKEMTHDPEVLVERFLRGQLAVNDEYDLHVSASSMKPNVRLVEIEE